MDGRWRRQKKAGAENGCFIYLFFNAFVNRQSEKLHLAKRSGDEERSGDACGPSVMAPEGPPGSTAQLSSALGLFSLEAVRLRA